MDRALRVLKVRGKLDLLVPTLVIEEFDRNRPRPASAVTTSVLTGPLVNATAPQNFREIDELLRDGTILGLPESPKP